MDWVSCIKNRIVKEVKIDKNLISSLIKSSARKFRTQELFELSNDSADSKITLLYDSVRELLEALAISKGYKIYNHACYFSFLKEIIKKDSLAKSFNNFRIIRNSINYYGKDISLEEAKDIIEDMKKFIKIIKEDYISSI